MARKARQRRSTQPRIPTQILERLPENQLLLYAHLWELETWLREMVYVELVARYGGDWELKVSGDPHRSYAGDRRLRHMPTREALPISYISLSQLRRTIIDEWTLFEKYLPPKDIWDAKLNEVEQVRNRVAHFRRGHPDDLKRVQQLLRDIDEGFWRFCTSYNSPYPIIDWKADPIVREFAELDPFPWTETEPNKFVRIGVAPGDLVMAVTIELLRRLWLKEYEPSLVGGHYGYLYDVALTARGNRSFDYNRFLKNTRQLHGKLCHICLNAQENLIRVTLPCVSGVETILPTLKQLVDEARNTLEPKSDVRLFTDLLKTDMTTSRADEIAMEWPEYVLGPSNPLTFLDPDMRCNFFGSA